LNHVIQIVDNFIFHGGDNKLLITLIHACIAQFEVVCDSSHETDK